MPAPVASKAAPQLVRQGGVLARAAPEVAERVDGVKLGEDEILGLLDLIRG
jgi:hypothetical protein